MYLRSTSLVFLLLVFFQAQADFFRRHYEAAEAQHRAGNFPGAEAEFKIILAEAYHRLGKVYSAQAKPAQSSEAFDSAPTLRPDSTTWLVDLSIAYFYTEQYSKGIEPLQRVLAS